MADRESNSPASGQLTTGPYQGPGCNGRFEPDERFFKFVHPEAQWNWKEDRPGTNVFKRERESANWAVLATPESTIIRKPAHGVVSVNTELCISLGQRIEYTPIRLDPVFLDNPAHCDIVGVKDRKIPLAFARLAKKWIRPEPCN